MDQPRLRLRSLLAPAPNKHGLPLRLRGRVHLPSVITAHIIPGINGPITPPRLRGSGIHITPGIATHIKHGLEAGGMPAETATIHQMPRIGKRVPPMRRSISMGIKSIASNVKHVNDGKWFPLTIRPNVNGYVETTLSTLSTTTQRASTDSQLLIHCTNGMQTFEYLQNPQIIPASPWAGNCGGLITTPPPN